MTHLWTERNATITWNACWRGKLSERLQLKEWQNDFILCFFVRPNFWPLCFILTYYFLWCPCWCSSSILGKSAFFWLSSALPSYLYTSCLTSFLTVFPLSHCVSSVSEAQYFICFDWYLFKTDHSFFSLLYTPSPSLSCISSSLSHIVLNHYSWACKAQKCTCPPMIWAWV